MEERLAREIVARGPQGFGPKRGSRNGGIFGQNGPGPERPDEAKASVYLRGRLARQTAEEIHTDIGRLVARFAKIPDGGDEVIVGNAADPTT